MTRTITASTSHVAIRRVLIGIIFMVVSVAM
jgi:hypothetical protein